MDTKRLYDLLNQCTVLLRKGEVVREETRLGVHVTIIQDMPHVDEVSANFEKVDMELLAIGVNKVKAEEHRNEFISLMDTYPEPQRLAGGPSYIEVGSVIGSQGVAFQMFAMGKVLGLWDVITPSSLGLTGEEARNIAGQGFIMITGYHGDTKRVQA